MARFRRFGRRGRFGRRRFGRGRRRGRSLRLRAVRIGHRM